MWPEATRLLKVCPVRALGAGVSGLGSGASGYEGGLGRLEILGRVLGFQIRSEGPFPPVKPPRSSSFCIFGRTRSSAQLHTQKLQCTLWDSVHGSGLSTWDSS